jgi:chemotaxis protein MotA
MQISFIIGIIWGVVLLIGSVFYAKFSILIFLDIPSFMITVGGSIGSLMVGYNFKHLMKMGTFFRICMFPPSYNVPELIVTVVSFSEKARREGLLALEDDLEELTDPFMKKGLQLVVDGTDPELVKNILENEVDQMVNRHDDNKRIFDDWATWAPAFGMIGTLMGLVMMLVNLEDRSAIGPALGIAIITTLYGAILCYLVFQPIGTRLTMMTNDEVLYKAVILMGVLSIQSGDNPRIVKDKLITYLPPDQREELAEEEIGV